MLEYQIDMVLEYQIDMVNFLLKYPSKWSTYANNISTINTVCSLVNLGIAKINKYNQFKLKSVVKAKDFITAKK